jgi:hypothetical protein
MFQRYHYGPRIVFRQLIYNCKPTVKFYDHRSRRFVSVAKHRSLEGTATQRNDKNPAIENK